MKIDYFFDPVCPFCWITSGWVRLVAPHRDLDVDWRLISLKVLNEEHGYEGKPDGYETSHAKGHELLRIVAAIKADLGPGPIGQIYSEFGSRIWNAEPIDGITRYEQIGNFGSEGEIGEALAAAGISTEYLGVAKDPSWDEVVRAETAIALERTGPDVGTPILTYGAPDGPTYFGPVISRLPGLDDALRLWDAMVTLGQIDTFAEVKRSLRETPQLRLLGQ